MCLKGSELLEIFSAADKATLVFEMGDYCRVDFEALSPRFSVNFLLLCHTFDMPSPQFVALDLLYVVTGHRYTGCLNSCCVGQQ